MMRLAISGSRIQFALRMAKSLALILWLNARYP